MSTLKQRTASNDFKQIGTFAGSFADTASQAAFVRMNFGLHGKRAARAAYRVDLSEEDAVKVAQVIMSAYFEKYQRALPGPEGDDMPACTECGDPAEVCMCIDCLEASSDLEVIPIS